MKKIGELSIAFADIIKGFNKFNSCDKHSILTACDIIPNENPVNNMTPLTQRTKSGTTYLKCGKSIKDFIVIMEILFPSNIIHTKLANYEDLLNSQQ